MNLKEIKWFVLLEIWIYIILKGLLGRAGRFGAVDGLVDKKRFVPRLRRSGCAGIVPSPCGLG